tara:strand:+ start:929 stop:1075 length:147 start_codon:yes stop_codon:yes gene_type:complete
MNKSDKKRIKLNVKAQDCISREKAQKVLKKWHKFEKPIRRDHGEKVTP